MPVQKMATRAVCLCCIIAVSFLSSAGAQLPAEVLHQGEQLFLDAKISESIAAFDKVIELRPEAKPQLWQRGLALYYADKFAEGRAQFEAHQTVNKADVENAAWHFLCVARLEGVESARKHLIPIEGDTRVPMKEVYELFAGRGTEAAVLEAAANGPGAYETRTQLCFAHLYLGLYYEALKDTAKAKEHMLKAANDYCTELYMGQVARVHLKVRGWE
ncbi:MAG: hypothetical protein JWO94_1350 [Verrucomicrobiaceae bacterium]|nr:hypothetical protein [Verrucomicrobiaceae bacterium]